MTFLSSEDAWDEGSGLGQDRWFMGSAGSSIMAVGNIPSSLMDFDIGCKRAKIKSTSILHSTSRSVK